jgi:hypothetical protein
MKALAGISLLLFYYGLEAIEHILSNLAAIVFLVVKEAITCP